MIHVFSNGLVAAPPSLLTFFRRHDLLQNLLGASQNHLSARTRPMEYDYVKA